jgi:chromosome segregation ATPase
VHEENQRLADASGGGYARKQKACEQAANDAAAAQKEYNEHRMGAGRLREDVELSQKEFEATQGPIEEKKKELEQAENRLRTLSREGGARQSGFHPRMPNLLRAIEQEESFQSRPVGPIGLHVTLLQPKWSSILESSFGGTLSSFIVTSRRDMNILSNIMRGVGW